MNGEGHEENWRAIFYLQLSFLIATQSPWNIFIVINIRIPSAFFNWPVNVFMGKGIKLQSTLGYITFHYGDDPPNLLAHICLTFSADSGDLHPYFSGIPSQRRERVTECVTTQIFSTLEILNPNLPCLCCATLGL